MNEVHTGALESIKHTFRQEIKDAKEELRLGKKLAHDGDTAGAKKKLQSAISHLKEGRKIAEKIDDDGVLEHLIIAGVMVMVPFGALAYTLGYYYEWYTLHTKSKEGEMEYSVAHERLRPNFLMEYFFGKLIAKGYSRSVVLDGYDKMIDEAERALRNIK